MTYTQTTHVPNYIFDTLLPELTEAELKVLLTVIRQTIGWFDKRTGQRKIKDRISALQFKQKTGLSQRKEEMFEFLWDKCKKRFNKKEPRLTAEIRKRILGYSFPGNIREMENMIDGIMAESEDVVMEEHLSGRITQPTTEHSLKLEDVERLHIKKVYEMCNGNAREAQRILGIKSANTLKAKIKSIYPAKNL